MLCAFGNLIIIHVIDLCIGLLDFGVFMAKLMLEWNRTMKMYSNKAIRAFKEHITCGMPLSKWSHNP